MIQPAQIRESVCHFGSDDGLFGILTTPKPDRHKTDAPIALILNAGIVHRIGPFRLHVDLARQMAHEGYRTMRLDLSGLGDSAQRTGKVDGKKRAQLDIREAMDYLEELTGTKRFVIIGLCSGAFNAHKVSVKDERIVGAVFMDGIVFRTLGFYVRHHIGRLFRMRFWRNAIKRRVMGELNESESERAGQTLAEGEFFGAGLKQDSVIDDLRTLMNRGVRMLFLYTGGYDDICGRSQFREMYRLQPDEKQLQVEYYPKSEHTFRLTENRQTACSRISSWMTSQF